MTTGKTCIYGPPYTPTKSAQTPSTPPRITKPSLCTRILLRFRLRRRETSQRRRRLRLITMGQRIRFTSTIARLRRSRGCRTCALKNL